MVSVVQQAQMTRTHPRARIRTAWGCRAPRARARRYVAVVDEAGALVDKVRIEDTAAGFTQLMHLLAVHGQGCETPIPVVIETAKGLLVANLRAQG